MSNGLKIFTLGAVIAVGIANAYYTFDPSLKELKDQREGKRKTAEPQGGSPQKDQDREKKVDESKKQ